jgi:hypothetical protein
MSETPIGVKVLDSGWLGPPANTNAGWNILQEKIKSSSQAIEL